MKLMQNFAQKIMKPNTNLNSARSNNPNNTASAYGSSQAMAGIKTFKAPERFGMKGHQQQLGSDPPPVDRFELTQAVFRSPVLKNAKKTQAKTVKGKA